LLVGLVDTIGRAFVPDLLHRFLSDSAASNLGRSLSSMMIYLLMAIVLILRPEGLFPAASK
ncbi:MAG TPA: branched-chain amino acid ABC transporter permease, partial [Xanthobacteraceae bacterium]